MNGGRIVKLNGYAAFDIFVEKISAALAVHQNVARIQRFNHNRQAFGETVFVVFVADSENFFSRCKWKNISPPCINSVII